MPMISSVSSINYTNTYNPVRVESALSNSLVPDTSSITTNISSTTINGGFTDMGLAVLGLLALGGNSDDGEGTLSPAQKFLLLALVSGVLNNI